MRIKWEEPPAKRTRGNRPQKHADFADELRKHPGQWAVFLDDASTTQVANIRTGNLHAFRPAGAFEAAARRDGTHEVGRARIYVRYIGLPDEVTE